MKNSTNDIQKKLKAYSALAGTALAVTNSASAQVVYTDVMPDLTFTTGGTYNLDLNNDGTIDFKLDCIHGTYYTIFQYDVVGVTPNFVNNAVDTLGDAAAHAVGIGFSVDSTLNWVDSTEMAAQFPPTASGLAAVIAGYGSGGNFLGLSGKFLPLRFTIIDETFYGWVRLNVAADAQSFTVIDYAYRNAPDSQSFTGLQTDASIHENELARSLNIYSYNKNIIVKMDQSVPAEAIVSVTNLLGQEITNVQMNDQQITIPMQETKTGIYLVTVRQNGDIFTKRVSIK